MTTSSSDRLKPCPFCGGPAICKGVSPIGIGTPCVVIECEKCWASTARFRTPAEAGAAWNLRAEKGR